MVAVVRDVSGIDVLARRVNVRPVGDLLASSPSVLPARLTRCAREQERHRDKTVCRAAFGWRDVAKPSLHILALHARRARRDGPAAVSTTEGWLQCRLEYNLQFLFA